MATLFEHMFNDFNLSDNSDLGIWAERLTDRYQAESLSLHTTEMQISALRAVLSERGLTTMADSLPKGVASRGY